MVNYGKREDGTDKGNGYFGEVPNPKGGPSTELSIGINLDGEETLIPTMVPGLSLAQLNSLVNLKDGEQPSKDIVDIAANHAIGRIRQGKSVWADIAEEGKTPLPSIMKIEATNSKKKTPVGKIMSHEGFRLEPYVDTEGYLTGGTGHKMSKQDIKDFSQLGTDDEKYQYWADKFDTDYASASTSAVRVMNDKGIGDNSVVEGVLVNMIFNMGESGVREFDNFLTALRDEDPDEAIHQMKTGSDGKTKSKWYRQVKGRVDELATEIKDAF